MSVEYETDYEVGQDNVQVLGMDMHNPVFFISAVLILVFVIGTIIFPAEAKTALDGAKGWTIDNFDWLFMVGANIFVLFCIALIFLPVGKIRLGGKDARPDFSTLSWFAMLFAAGMGIGLMFWSVAEPVGYYTDWFGTPLNVEPNTPQAKDMALGAVMYHWGLHPWAIYGVVALSLAFFAYNKGMPLTIRSAFYPILGERCWGWAGHVIDVLAVLATIFGLATSLGLGAKQAAGGMHFLFDTPNAINVQIAIIVGVTAAAVISVMRGLDGGVKLLSNINMGLAALLLLFVMIAGPTLLIFTSMGQTAVDYVVNIIPLSNWVGREDQGFLHDWTVFYWAWWISWSPFVGMFIARVSRGRTVREFLTAVLLVPTLVTVVWMATFGGSGLHQTINGIGELANGVGDSSLALFQMLAELPLTAITSFLAIVLVLVFFITSSDSGSLVIDSITAGGKLDAPVPQRVFWAIMEGLIAGALLYGGGEQALNALQAGAITTGLPFTVVLLVMCFSLYKGLSAERKLMTANP
ncbi:MAG TPA: glycine/betaine ABC transporter [Alcanivorax sp.]|jgi:BCCT family betaine/carnitine transporter|uniref:BCCT family transporter n=1 Tax=Alloalcanivorax venustensis TaxID=172371 RepID=UPI000C372E46|nr:glycine/betaine ABC transporter [Alcanivorax sp.]MBT74507.1 glycine/betaine ABC transporter [Alcanivorax sp.]HAD47171.1 glycine/betaine ABC transporter [Alcanivorax sp.]HAI88528.1 glycine/betaine ABC transporter [Alcanivorax sp.]HCD76620.1 glycine/betaine ABC transporter [Alcanivorax sp.]|tara:strand:- start:4065 stop:5633 length:1569 start_codon:yes stop_codon:yes gene_type:complete